jgi:hypothetical protein
MGFGPAEALGFHRNILSVTPICTGRSGRNVQVQWSKTKSVTPKIENRSYRDVFGGNLTLNFLLESRSNELIWCKENCNRGETLGIPIVHRIEDGSTSGIETHPNSVEFLYGGNGGEEMAVDDDGDLR